jgi:hypothetical protein
VKLPFTDVGENSKLNTNHPNQSTPFTSAANGRPIEGTVRQNHAILRQVSRVTLVEELVAPRPEKWYPADAPAFQTGSRSTVECEKGGWVGYHIGGVSFRRRGNNKTGDRLLTFPPCSSLIVKRAYHVDSLDHE